MIDKSYAHNLIVEMQAMNFGEKKARLAAVLAEERAAGRREALEEAATCSECEHADRSRMSIVACTRASGLRIIRGAAPPAACPLREREEPALPATCSECEHFARDVSSHRRCRLRDFVPAYGDMAPPPACPLRAREEPAHAGHSVSGIEVHDDGGEAG